MTQENASLELIIADVTDAIRRAYAEGVRRGSLDAVEKMTRAVSRSIGSLSAKPSVEPMIASPRVDKRSQGSIINLFRLGLRAAAETGMSRKEIEEFCRANGLDVTPNQYREIMKRLTGGQEAVRKYGVYFPGPQFRADLIPDMDGERVIPPQPPERPRRNDIFGDVEDASE